MDENKGNLISREALKKHITEVFEIEEKIDKKWTMGLKYSLKLIDDATTVSIDWGIDNGDKTVYSRPQGEWIFKKFDEVKKND